MNALKTNIDHYMELKNIKMYSHLLVDIAHETQSKRKFEYNARLKAYEEERNNLLTTHKENLYE